MKIKELWMKNFGRFTDQRIEFGEGINLIYGENEAGKTTIHHFIRAMFFGLEKQRGKAARTDLYSTYEPWNNPLGYAGTCRFICGGKVFRIERSFHKAQKEAHLVCETDGEELSLEHGDLEMLLDGMTETGFDNTISIRQLKSATDSRLAAELKNYAANYYESGDFLLDIDKAISTLGRQRKELQRKAALERDKHNTARNAIQSRLAYIEEEIAEKEEKLQQYEQEIREHKKAMAADREKEQQEEAERRAHLARQKRQHQILGWFPIIGAVLMLVLFYPERLFIGLSILCATLGIWFLRKKPVREEAKVKVGPVSDKNLATKKLWHAELLKEELKERYTDRENLQESLDELDEPGEAIRLAEENVRAVELAIRKIYDLSGDVQQAQAGRLNRRASQIFAEITDEKYQHLVIDEDLQIKINTRDKLLPLHQVSRGTLEQIYFALRMAAAEILWPESEVPVILDDTFAMYDQKRLANTLKWLAKREGQTIVFTCHRREQQIMEACNIPYHSIRL